GHQLSLRHEDRAVLDLDLAGLEEVGRFPAGQRLAIEEELPAGLILAGYRGTGGCRGLAHSGGLRCRLGRTTAGLGGSQRCHQEATDSKPPSTLVHRSILGRELKFMGPNLPAAREAVQGVSPSLHVPGRESVTDFPGGGIEGTAELLAVDGENRHRSKEGHTGGGNRRNEL